MYSNFNRQQQIEKEIKSHEHYKILKDFFTKTAGYDNRTLPLLRELNNVLGQNEYVRGMTQMAISLIHNEIAEEKSKKT